MTDAMWFYQEDFQRVGPVGRAELAALVQQGRADASTMVWKEGMTDWQPVAQTDLADLLTKVPPPAVVPPPVGGQQVLGYSGNQGPLPTAEDAQRLRSWFTTFWICLAVGLPLCIIVIGAAGVIAASIFYLLIMHKCWGLIPPRDAKTTPGKAIGFMFIPFFNLYWNFVAIHGLAQALNAERRRLGVRDAEVSEGMCLAYCILVCCSIIPYLGIFTGLAALVIWVIAVRQFKDAGVALIQRRVASLR